VLLAVISDTHLPRGSRRLPEACVERLRRAFPRAAAVIFGHSHIPLHERAPDGFQIFNPATRPTAAASPSTRWAWPASSAAPSASS
jgi:predicted phosphodiesterase